MNTNLSQFDPFALWDTSEEENKNQFIDSAVLESLQDVPYGQMLTQEEQAQVIDRGPEYLDLEAFSPETLFADIDEADAIVTEPPQMNQLTRFVRNAFNATLEPSLGLADYMYQYGIMAPMNILSNAAQGKPLFESPGITEAFTFDVPEAQTREEEIQDVAANSFGTIMSFVLPTGLMARGGSAVGAITNKAVPMLLAQNTPKAVLQVAGRPKLISKLSPEQQLRFRSAYRDALRIPVLGTATKATRQAAKRAEKGMKDFAEIRGQILPNLLSDYVNTPGRALAFEALAASTAAQGAAIAEAIAPGSITGRIYGELIGGLGSAVIAGPVTQAVSATGRAITSPKATFKNVINKFTGDDKAMLEIVNLFEKAARAKLVRDGLDPTPENIDSVIQDIIKDVMDMDSVLGGMDLTLGIQSKNEIVMAFESRLAEIDPEFAKFREKKIMEAYDFLYSYLNAAMSKGSPNSINAAARLQQFAFDSAHGRQVDIAQRAAIEAADQLFGADQSPTALSLRQYEINRRALDDTRDTETKLWESAIDDIQPDSAEGYSSSLQAYNTIRGSELPDSESLSIQPDFERMRDAATYAEIKKQLPELEALARDESNEDAVRLFEAATARLQFLELKYGASARKLRGLLRLGVPENIASLISGNSVDSISYRYKGPTFTVRDLHNVRSKSLQLARRFRRSNPNAARQYEDIAEALLRDLIKLNNNTPEYLTAINFSRALNKNWNEGFSKTVFRGVEMGNYSPEATLEMAFVKSSGLKTRLRFDALDRASVPLEISDVMGVENLVPRGASRDIQGEFLRAKLPKIVSSDGKTVDPKKLQAFFEDEDFMKLANEMPNLVRDLKNAETAQALVDDLIQTGKANKDLFAKSALYNFLGKTQADRVIKTMLVESDASENFASLMRELRHYPRYLIKQYKDFLTEAEIRNLERSQPAALEGIQNSLFRIAHDISTSGDITSFVNMRNWLNTAPPGELSPVELMRQNRVLTGQELDNMMAYVNRGAELQEALASKDVLEVLESMQDPLSDLVLRISGANLGGAISRAMSGETSLIAQSGGSNLLRQVFAKMPVTKLNDISLRMLKDRDFFVEVLRSKAIKNNPNLLYSRFRSFYLENGYLTAVSILDSVAEELGITEITEPVISDIMEQRMLQPSEMEMMLPPSTPEMQQRGIRMMRPQTRGLLERPGAIDIEGAQQAISNLRPPVLSNVLFPEEQGRDRGAERYVTSNLKPEQKETVQQFRPLWDSLEEQYNLPERWLEVVAFIESSYNPQAIGVTNADAKGFFQFTPITLIDYPHDPFNPEQNSEAAARYASNNKRFLERSLGREPNPFELYLAHQQGAKGAFQLLTAPPSVLAADVRNRSAISGQNLDPDTTTVKQFIDKFKNRYNEYARGVS